jgi:phosphohistidine phosphatase
MNLYIVRHTDAEYLGTGEFGERRITQEGRDQLSVSVINWKNFIQKLDLLLCSPALRTVETMEVIVRGLEFTGEKFITNSLQSGSKIKEMYSLVNSYSEENVMLVMHEPETTLLITDCTGIGSFDIYFKPGTIAKIAFNGKMRPHTGRLHFLLPPDIFNL